MESNNRKRDKSLIPSGPYCYTRDWGDQIKMCPYYSHKIINTIKIPWCNYLNLGGFIGDHTAVENQLEKLQERYKTKEELDKELPLFLLFDACKECGENYDKERDLE